MPETSVPDLLKPQWFQILLALSRGPLHGAAIMEEVLERTDGAMKLWPATLYGSLRDLEEAGWIEEADADDPPQPGGRRNVHALTAEGRAVLIAELERLEATLDVARRRRLLDSREAV
ncbi:MAG: PadR family transcriptional regulator [Gemmatimonadota bacterium]